MQEKNRTIMRAKYYANEQVSMKKIYIFFLMLFISNHTSTAPGCLDDSYRLTQRNDTKSFHQVTCDCPCEKKYAIVNRRSICSKCRHHRDPRIIEHNLRIKRGFVDCPSKNCRL